MYLNAEQQLNNMKKHWWKFLGGALLIYSLLAGMLVPLKPGIYNASPFKLKAGQTQTLQVKGYNTFYTQSKKPIRAWLKYDDQHALAAQKIDVISDSKLDLSFEMPAYYPGETEAVSLTLYIDSDADGAAVLPDAVTVVDNHPNNKTIDAVWTTKPINGLSASTGMHYPYRSMLGETIRNTFYHVPFWFSMMIIFITSMVYSWRFLSTLDLDYDRKAVAFSKIGVLYGMLGLATGSVWAKYTWGDWWNFDIKQNMAAIAMLIYLAYFVLRSSFDDEEKKARISAVYNIFAFATLIPLLFVIPRLVDSLHPGSGGNPGFGVDDLDNTMRMVLYPAVIGWTLVGAWMANLMVRMDRIKERLFMDF